MRLFDTNIDLIRPYPRYQISNKKKEEKKNYLSKEDVETQELDKHKCQSNRS